MESSARIKKTRDDNLGAVSLKTKSMLKTNQQDFNQRSSITQDACARALADQKRENITRRWKIRDWYWSKNSTKFNEKQKEVSNTR